MQWRLRDVWSLAGAVGLSGMMLPSAAHAAQQLPLAPLRETGQTVTPAAAVARTNVSGRDWVDGLPRVRGESLSASEPFKNRRALARY